MAGDRPGQPANSNC